VSKIVNFGRWINLLQAKM